MDEEHTNHFLKGAVFAYEQWIVNFSNEVKNSLKKNGYLSQSNLNYKRENHKILKKKYGNDEIGVVIGRNGEIIKLKNKYNGTNRLEFKKKLNIKNNKLNIKDIHNDILKHNN